MPSGLFGGKGTLVGGSLDTTGSLGSKEEPKRTIRTFQNQPTTKSNQGRGGYSLCPTFMIIFMDLVLQTPPSWLSMPSLVPLDVAAREQKLHD